LTAVCCRALSDEVALNERENGKRQQKSRAAA